MTWAEILELKGQIDRLRDLYPSLHIVAIERMPHPARDGSERWRSLFADVAS